MPLPHTASPPLLEPSSVVVTDVDTEVSSVAVESSVVGPPSLLEPVVPELPPSSTHVPPRPSPAWVP